MHSLITVRIKKEPYAYCPCIFEVVKCKLSHHTSRIYTPSSVTLNCDYNIRSKNDPNSGPEFIVASNLVLCLYHILKYVFQSICEAHKAMLDSMVIIVMSNCSMLSVHYPRVEKVPFQQQCPRKIK